MNFMGEMVMLCTTNPSKIDKLLNTELSIDELVDIFNWGDKKQRLIALEKIKKSIGTLDKWIEIYKNNRSNLLLPIAAEKIDGFVKEIVELNELVKAFRKCQKMVSPQNIIAQRIEETPATLDQLITIQENHDLLPRVAKIIIERIRHEFSLINDINEVQKYKKMQRLNVSLYQIVNNRISELS